MSKELTLRGLLLGSLITLVFIAANVHLGLNVGLTFASSSPAAVISMAIPSMITDSSILRARAPAQLDDDSTCRTCSPRRHS